MPDLSPEATGAARLLMALPGEVRAPVAGALSALVAWVTAYFAHRDHLVRGIAIGAKQRPGLGFRWTRWW